MKILINDVLQYATAGVPDELISPSLADRDNATSYSITLDTTRDIDCFGIGNTDATEVTINGDTITLASTDKNGLYLLTSELSTSSLTITHNGSYIGRLAVGKSRSLGAAPAREPGFYTTAEPRITASGQVVEGAGGVSGRTIQLDFRYKFTQDIFDDIEAAYEGQISRGFPFFLYFDKETHRMPWERLYASSDQELVFQSSVNRFLYSRRMTFTERF